MNGSVDWYKELTNPQCERFFITGDMNGDHAFTIADVWLIAEYIWLLPAKVVVALVESEPKWSSFFEINCATGNGWGGAVFSAFVWLILFTVIAKVLDHFV